MAANQSNSKRYYYYNKDGAKKQYDIPNMLNDQAIQAKTDQQRSSQYINDTFIHIWNKSIKSYFLHTGDREGYIKDWQSNIALGLIRSNVSTYEGIISETPLQYVATPIDARALEPTTSNPSITNMEAGIKAVNFIADVTRLNEEVSLSMMDTVIMGFSVLKTTPDTGDLKNTDDDDITTLTFVNWEFQEKTFKSNKTNLPKTISVDPYKIYPDFSNGKNPQHICERDIVSIDRFLEMFLPIITHESNKIKGYAPVLADLLRNNSMATFVDYGNIRDEIFAHENRNLAKTDSIYNANRRGQWNTSSMNNNALKPNENMVEYIYATYNDRIVLIANGYPISISDNFLKVLPYDIITMYQSRELITEWLPYLLFGLQDMQDSFGNNLIDNARVAAVGKLVWDKSAFDMSEEEVEALPPGWIAWTNGKNPSTALVAMPTNPVSDFGIMNMADMYAQKQTGISEINQGIASKVRTASEAASLVGSTNRRMNQMFQRFSRGLWRVAEKQLAFSRLLWTNGQWWYNRDLNGKLTTWTMSGDDLNDSYYLSLDSQGMFAANDESALTKMNDAYRTFWADLPPDTKLQLVKAIMRKMQIFLPEDTQLVDKTIKPEDTALSDSIGTNGAPLPPLWETLPESLTRAMSPQANFGNGWEGQA